MAVDRQLHKWANLIPGLGKAPGAAVEIAEGIPCRILPEAVVGIHPLHLHGIPREQLPALFHHLPQIQLNGMAENELFLLHIVGSRPVVQQQGRVHGNLVQKAAAHGHAAAGIDGKGTAVFHKIADSLQIPLRNGGIRCSQSAVIIYG